MTLPGGLDLAGALVAAGWVEVRPGVWRHDTPPRYFGCPTGKAGYESEPLALVALADVQARREREQWPGPVERRVYECPLCSLWHLTHAKLRRRGRRAAP